MLSPSVHPPEGDLTKVRCSFGVSRKFGYRIGTLGCKETRTLPSYTRACRPRSSLRARVAMRAGSPPPLPRPAWRTAGRDRSNNTGVLRRQDVCTNRGGTPDPQTLGLEIQPCALPALCPFVGPCGTQKAMMPVGPRLVGTEYPHGRSLPDLLHAIEEPHGSSESEA